MTKIRHTSSLASKSTDALLRATLSDALRRSKKGRTQVAEELTESIGRSISVHALNSWTSHAKPEHRIPADIIPALCEALADDRLQRALLSPEMIDMLKLGEWASSRLGKDLSGEATQKQRGKQFGKTVLPAA